MEARQAVKPDKKSFKTAEGRYQQASERLHLPGTLLGDKSPRAPQLTHANLVGAGDIDGPYLIVNVGDALLISDFNCIGKQPCKTIIFTGHWPMCHAFLPTIPSTHPFDLLVGFSSGQVALVSLKQQLLDPSSKLVGGLLFNRDGSYNTSRCTSVAWAADGSDVFVVGHADGSVYVCERGKEPCQDPQFAAVKDATLMQFTVSPKAAKHSPTARWWPGQAGVTALTFNSAGAALAVGLRDGTVRVVDLRSHALLGGFKTYFGAVLCVAWSQDDRYIVAAGEDDLLCIYSWAERAVVAWGEGHRSWVSAVAFDRFWECPSTSGLGEPAPTTYRLVSIAQDCQIALWEFCPEDVCSLQAAAGTRAASPAPASCSAVTHSPKGKRKGKEPASDLVLPASRVRALLAPAPRRCDVLRLAPVVMQQVHAEPLLGLVVTEAALVTACQAVQLKLWLRPKVWQEGVGRELQTHQQLSMHVDR